MALSSLPPPARRCARKFLRHFPGGFADQTYVDWERGYKWKAHEAWSAELAPATLRSLLRAGGHAEVARRAIRIESRTNLLVSFEKTALRDAVRSAEGARTFATGLERFLHGRGDPEARFGRWVEAIEALPRRQTRVLTWPMATIFGFIAQPEEHCFLKPVVTKVAAAEYDFPFAYASRPNWDTYASLLAFTARVRLDLRSVPSLRARDQIDLQSFLWVQGSAEYDED
jgi:hypothetical protein